MMARIRKSLDEKEKGFTLIELLVVMIIIGILAAIAIPVFLNQRTKAAETAAKADVSTIGKEVAAYYVDGSGGLAVTGGSATTAGTWTLTTGATPISVATGRLSMGDVATGSATSLAAYCFTVTPVTPARAWSYGQNGLVLGTTCP